MLGELNTALRHLMHDHGLIDAREVDVEFHVPVKAWTGSLIRPTLDFFLFQLHENTELRQAGMHTSRGNGVGVHRVPARRFDLSYLVSAVTSDVVDEHLLLWRTLVTLMKYPTLPDDIVPDPIRASGLPVVTRVGRADDSARALDMWSALESPPRPALLYIVTVPVDLEVEITAPLVLTRTARYTNMRDAVPMLEERTHIGGTVVDRRGQPVAGARVWVHGRAREPVITNAAGEYTLPDVPIAGRIQLRVARSEGPPAATEILVPSPSYALVVD
jgi:hypothetical protein